MRIMENLSDKEYESFIIVLNAMLSLDGINANLLDDCIQVVTYEGPDKVIVLVNGKVEVRVESDNPKYPSFKLCSLDHNNVENAARQVRQCIDAPYPYGPANVCLYRLWQERNENLDSEVINAKLD